MSQVNSAKLYQAPMISFKPLLAIKDCIFLLAAAFSEAKVMELKSRKTSGNW